VGFILTTLALGFFGHIDIYAEGTGRIQPRGRSKVLQPSTTGIVRAIAVQNGDLVSAGQAILSLDATEAGATFRENKENRDSLRAEIARRSFEIKSARATSITLASRPIYPPGMPLDIIERQNGTYLSDMSLLRANVDELSSKAREEMAKEKAAASQIVVEEQSLAALRSKLDIRTQLQSEGWDSRIDLLDARQDFEKELAEIRQTEGSLRLARVAKATAEADRTSAIEKFISDQAQQLNEAQTKLTQATQDTVKANTELGRMTLRSPISGVVQELAVTTVGQVVTPGEQLLTVVPLRGRVEVAADIKSEDIAYVRSGQPVEIKVRAYPFTQYGVVHGRVVSVAHDSVELNEAAAQSGTHLIDQQASVGSANATPATQNLVYPVTIQIDSDRLVSPSGRVKLLAGMAVDVEITTGRRRVISYVLSPLLQGLRSAGHER
jgi:hemolysin D